MPNILLVFILFFSLLFSSLLIFLKEEKEKYDYNYALRTGKLIGGSVFASYPYNAPGLGWIN